MTYSRNAGGCVKTSVLNDTVPLVEHDAHLRRIRCKRSWRGRTRIRSAHCVTCDLNATTLAGAGDFDFMACEL